MKRLIYTAILLLYFCTSVYAQSGWFWQNPLPQGNNLKCVKFVNQNTSFAGGYCGTILKTTNNGANWRIIATDASFICTSFYFHNENTGWAISSQEAASSLGDSKILKTIDAGNNWSQKYYMPACYLTSIEFTGMDTGYIMSGNGTYGSIYKTTNSGVNWIQIYTITSYYPASSYFINCNTGFVCGSFGIKKTTNGGINWIDQLINGGLPTSLGLYSIKFANANTGFSSGYRATITASYPVIYKTTNFGTNWVMQVDLGSARLDCITLLNEDIAFACGGISLIKTTNGGINWSDIPLQSGFYRNSIDMKFSNGMVVGDLGIIFNTSNSGANWYNNYPSIADFKSANCIKFFNKYLGYAISGTKFLKTTNGGLNWIVYSTPAPATNTLYSFSILDSNVLIVVGGVFSAGINFAMKTTNGGLNWIIQNSQLNDAILSISFANLSVGYCISWGAISKTTNGGNNWIALTAPGNQLKSIYFVNVNTGFITAWTTSYKTTNGGVNWNTMSVDGESTYFFNADTGYIVSMGRKIIKTTNGGLNWVVLLQSYNGLRFYNIHFYNSMIGYAVGDYGAIAKTTNGGNNWYYQKSPTDNLLLSVCVTDTNECYASGENCTIIKTTNGGVPIGVQTIANINPVNFFLSQNYPNPFNPSTAIKFAIPKLSHVKIVVYDLLGREIAELLNEEKKAGSYEVNWDGSNYSSGVYFYKIITNDFTETKKMVLMK